MQRVVLYLSPTRFASVVSTSSRHLHADSIFLHQHLSALMMCSPLMQNGLVINIKQPVASFSYLKITEQVMKKFGAKVSVTENKIVIKPSVYKNISFKAGGDWSAASYFFEIAALSERAEIKITGLENESEQGDKIIAELMKPFGVSSEKITDGILIRKEKNSKIIVFHSVKSVCAS